MNTSRFDSTKHSLHDLLTDIETGKIQLPDFQRDWIWDSWRIRSLIASISLSFPIGTVMTLETGGKHVNFKARPIEGTDSRLLEVNPETLILDGQQRLTSLFQSLVMEQPVTIGNSTNEQNLEWYYLDMNKCARDNADREDAVISVPKDRMRKYRREVYLDLSSSDKEYAQDMFPLNKVFDPAKWRRGYSDYWKRDRDKIEFWDNFERNVIEVFKRYQVPVINLDKETSKEAVCLIFEKVNTRGIFLDVFELLTASFAADNFLLRDDWKPRKERLEKYQILNKLDRINFLQVLTLLSTKKQSTWVNCRRQTILNLEVKDYTEFADSVEEGFVKAVRFLHEQKIYNARDLPSHSQLVSLAAILTDLGNEITADARQKIINWYWCGVFDETYGRSNELQFAQDLVEVTNWVRSNFDTPRLIQEASFDPNRLYTLQNRKSKAYKGIHALLMRDGGRDFLTGETIESQTFFDDKIDVHHIFPQVWCKKQGIPRRYFDSIINKTPLASRTNRKIGGRAPSEYLAKIQKEAGLDCPDMDEILLSHHIPVNALRADDFWQFFDIRKEKLLEAINSVMGNRSVMKNRMLHLKRK